jgi:hypothetical protein
MSADHRNLAAEEPLLTYLDALVHARRGPLPKNLRGRLCFGVRFAGRTSWWVADFGPKGAETRTSDRLPAQFDMAMAMDRRTAMWTLGAAPTKGDLHLSTGDLSLWEEFVEAYLQQRSMLSIRTGRGS